MEEQRIISTISSVNFALQLEEQGNQYVDLSYHKDDTIQMNFLIINFLLTKKYQRQFNIDYGFGLADTLFNLNDLVQLDEVQFQIKQQLQQEFSEYINVIDVVIDEPELILEPSQPNSDTMQESYKYKIHVYYQFLKGEPRLIHFIIEYKT